MEEIELVQINDNYHLYNFTNEVYDVSSNGDIKSTYLAIELKQYKPVLDKGVSNFKLGILLDTAYLNYINPLIKLNSTLRLDNVNLDVECKLVNMDGETVLIIHSPCDQTLSIDEDKPALLAYFTSDVYFWDSVNVKRNYGTLIRSHSIKHPYYPSTYDVTNWSSVDDFLTEYRDADLNYNLVIRWDIIPVSVNVRDMVITLWHPRKSYIVQHQISDVGEEDMPKLIDYLEDHRTYHDKLWNPIQPNVPKLTTLTYMSAKHTQNWVCDEDPSQIIPKGTALTAWFRGERDITVEVTLEENLPLNTGLGLLEEAAKEILEEEGLPPEVNPNFIEGVTLEGNRINFHVGT